MTTNHNILTLSKNPSPEAPVMDLTNLWSMIGENNSPMMMSFIHAFLESAVERLAELHQATHIGDRESIELHAHTLKSNSRNFSATQLASLCEQLELSASQGDLSQAAAQLAAIEQQYLKVKAALDMVVAHLEGVA